MEILIDYQPEVDPPLAENAIRLLSIFANSPIVVTPRLIKNSCVFLPHPGSLSRGNGARNCFSVPAGTSVIPLGFLNPNATSYFAKLPAIKIAPGHKSFALRQEGINAKII